jgi:hypothetical protein
MVALHTSVKTEFPCFFNRNRQIKSEPLHEHTAGSHAVFLSD